MFVQSTVNVRRQGTRIQTVVLLQKLWCCLLTSGMVIKLWTSVVIQSHGVWIMKRHMMPSTKQFKWLWHSNDELHEVRLGGSVIEHKEPIKMVFLILQYAKLRLLEPYHSLSCNLLWYWQIWGMDIDALYLALAEEELYDCIKVRKHKSGNCWVVHNVAIRSLQTLAAIFSPTGAVLNTKKTWWKKPGLFKDDFWWTELLCLCNQTYCCNDSVNQKFFFSRRGVKKLPIVDSGDASISKSIGGNKKFNFYQ